MSPSPPKAVLVIDGEEGDRVALAEAAKGRDKTGQLEIFLVTVRLNDWAHWEFGGDPDLLRFQIEFEQLDAVARAVESSGFEGCWRAHLLSLRWRIDKQLRAEIGSCDRLIISTSSIVVRWRLLRLARRAQVRLTFLERHRRPLGGRCA
jgi:hypothetical protein